MCVCVYIYIYIYMNMLHCKEPNVIANYLLFCEKFIIQENCIIFYLISTNSYTYVWIRSIP